MPAVIRRLANFIRQEEGSATIESLLWIPLLFSVLLLGLDVSLISTKQAMVMRIIQDNNRSYALGRYDRPDWTDKQSEGVIEGTIRNSIASISPGAKVNAEIAPDGSITTRVEMPASDLSSFGLLPNWEQMNIVVALQHTKEF
jgi:Flp pilus assembly protein TadG